MVVADAQTGVFITIPGRIDADPKTGQLTAAFEEAPQLPFEDLRLEFFKGAVAPLKTGIACGTFKVDSDLTPWTAPEGAVIHPSRLASKSSRAPAKAPCVERRSLGAQHTALRSGHARTRGRRLLAVHPENRPRRRQPADHRDRHDAAARACSRSSPGSPTARSGAWPPPPRSPARTSRRPLLPGASRVGRRQRRRRRRPEPVLHERRRLPGRPLQRRAAEPCGDHARCRRARSTSAPSSSAMRSTSTPPAPRSGPSRTRSRRFSRGSRSISARSSSASTGRASPRTRPAARRSRSPARSPPSTGQSTPILSHFQVGDCGELAFKPKLALSVKGGVKRRGHPALKAVLTLPEGQAQHRPRRRRAAEVGAPRQRPHQHGLHPGPVRCPASARPPRSTASPGRSRRCSTTRSKARSTCAARPTSCRTWSPTCAGRSTSSSPAASTSTKGGGLRATFEDVPDARSPSSPSKCRVVRKACSRTASTSARRNPRLRRCSTGRTRKTVDLTPPYVAKGCKPKARRRPQRGKAHKRRAGR